MDAAERRRLQNRDAQRRFRSKQSASGGAKAQQKAPRNSNTRETMVESSGGSSRRQSSITGDTGPPPQYGLPQFYLDLGSTAADDLGTTLRDQQAANMSLPLQLDLDVRGIDVRSSTSHMDCATQWLNAFPLDACKDASTGDLRWHEIGHLAQLQHPSDAQSLSIPPQPSSLSSRPAYGTPPETPKRHNPPHINTTNAGQVPEGSDHAANDNDDDDDADPEACFQTALHIAAVAGHDAMIDMLLGNGRLDVDARDSQGNTALHAAVASRKLAVVLRLLSHGADPDAANAAGWTPLHTAVQMGSVDIVGALVAHGGDVGKRAPVRSADPM